MAHVNLWVPEPLRKKLLAAERAGVELNWSAIFQEAAMARLSELEGCSHRRLRCSDCGLALVPEPT